MNKATCLSLLSNAVLVWNTVHMTRIVAQLRAAGETITDEELARISPPHLPMSFPMARTLRVPHHWSPRGTAMGLSSRHSTQEGTQRNDRTA